MEYKAIEVTQELTMDHSHLQDESKENLKILVVDDDRVVCGLLVDAVMLCGYEVEACGDGAEAFYKTQQNGYDLIITDMMLPGLDGLSLIRRLEAEKRDTDVIVITGHASIENAVECMKAGARDYLVKPITIDQIQIAIEKAVEHRELRRLAQEREFYRELCYVDPLTGICNRRFLDEALPQQVQKATMERTSFLFLMIDVDDFSIYNLNNLHQKGDEALTRLGQVLKSACRGSDIVSRYGGEEFAIIFPRAHRKNAHELCNRVLNEVRATAFDGEERQPLGALTVSIGVSCYPDDATTSEELIRCSDQALYESKRLGKNRITLYWEFAHQIG